MVWDDLKPLVIPAILTIENQQSILRKWKIVAVNVQYFQNGQK